jgi:hypothetical protein
MSWLDRIYGAFAPSPRQAPQPQPPLAALAQPPVRATSFSPIPTTGPTLANYPTSNDAETARRGGFGYGEPTSAYIEGTAGRIFGDKKGALPMEGRAPADRVSLHGDPDEFWNIANRAWTTPTTQNRDPTQTKILQSEMTQAALAANYSPLAALGFDPRMVTTDVSGRSKLGALAGMTDPETGRMVYKAGDSATIIHEAMHRALLTLKDDKRLPARLQARLQNPAHEESTVRQFVKAQAGNPEKDEAARDQQGQGPQWTPEEMQIVNKLAQEKIAKNRPRGPR